MTQAQNHTPQADFTAQKLQLYISSHLAKPSIGEACSELGLTRRTLQRRLYEVGTSFQKLVILTRIQYAQKLLLESHLPITQIAADVGFATLQAFSSAFRRETGHSPSSYRTHAQSRAVSETLELEPTSRASAAELSDIGASSPPPSGPRLVEPQPEEPEVEGLRFAGMA